MQQSEDPRPMTTFPIDQLDRVEMYKLMTGLIVPRPIGWIGTYGANGVANLAPYSFFQAVATNPPVVMFSTGMNEGAVKDSLANCRESQVFTA
ncbi:MAG: flavin reductase family protein, partial [Acidimicrobiales bacterium]